MTKLTASPLRDNVRVRREASKQFHGNMSDRTFEERVVPSGPDRWLFIILLISICALFVMMAL